MISITQNSEEAERLAIYEAWPKTPPKIRRAILLMIEATTEAESETQLESISRPSTATNGNQ